MEREKFPGELLLDEISKLPEEERDKLNYGAICHIIAEEMAVRAIRASKTICDLPLMEEEDGIRQD